MTVITKDAPRTGISGKSGLEEAPPRQFLTIEEAVDLVVDRLSVKLVLNFLAVCCTILNTGAATYVTIFTGYIPYNDWKCLSQKCTDLQATAGSSETFHSYNTMCKNDLVADIDFEWTSKKNTFSRDWGFYCKSEAKLSLVSSIIFIGSLLGLLFSTCLFDWIGRKRGAILGSVLTLLSLAASSVANSYPVLILLRAISGFGLIVNYTGSYCWIVELAPTFLRNPISGFFTLGWTAGTFILIGLSYFIDQWHQIYLAVAIMNVLGIIPFFLLPLPVSPRFSLIKGKKEEAMKTLQVLAQLSGSKVSLDTIDLIYEERNQSYLKQIKDFKPRIHPTMLKETLLGMVVWFMVSLISYSYQFGWSKIGNDLHSIYFFAALGDGIAYSTSVLGCRLLGRKKATFFYFGVVILMNLLAMLDVRFTATWSLEHLVSIIGNIATSSAFVMMYLYTGELAPTSHRGMILCLSSSCARIGSFVGPYVNLLYGVTDRRVPLALFAGLSLLACLAVWFLPDTTGRSVPETPGDVENYLEKKKEEEEEEDGKIDEDKAGIVLVNGLNGHLDYDNKLV